MSPRRHLPVPIPVVWVFFFFFFFLGTCSTISLGVSGGCRTLSWTHFGRSDDFVTHTSTVLYPGCCRWTLNIALCSSSNLTPLRSMLCVA